jgi:heme oxygenase
LQLAVAAMGDRFGLVERLAAETREHHADADADVDRFLFRAATTHHDYRAFLIRIYGFVMPLEAALVAAPGLTEVIDLDDRTKAPALLHDLVALGLTHDDLAEVPLCLSVPAFRGPAAALGWLYVVERPMLATAVLRRHLATRLGAQMEYASAYLQLYGGTAGTRWRELGVALDRVAGTEAIADRVIAAATDAFRCMHRWRASELGWSSSVRIAG